MIQNYKILTVTHHQTNLNIIGQFVMDGEESNVLRSLLDATAVEEMMYLSTCNRVMYFFYGDLELNREFVHDFFARINSSLSVKALATVEQFEGVQAIEHLYQVSASVNSMVVGEREILRQLRDAYAQSQSWGLVGDNIRLAMDQAVVASKDVYSNTRIGEKPVSIVSLAMQKLIKTNVSRDSRVLLIGAGQTNKLVSKFLKKYEFDNVTVFNRSIEKALQLANKFSSAAYTLDYLGEYASGFDIMVVCTGATEPIIQHDVYKMLLQGDTDEKIVIDLSIPNNVANDVVEHFNVHYIEIDGLKLLAKENMAFRIKEIESARELIAVKISEFQSLFQQRQIEKAMRKVPAQIKEIKAHAMDSVFKKEVEELDESTLALVNRMMSYMEKRCIAIPMEAAKKVVS